VKNLLNNLTYQPQPTMRASLTWARENITRVANVRDSKKIPVRRKLDLLNLVNRVVFDCLCRFHLPRLRSIRIENRGKLTRYPGMMSGRGVMYLNVFKATQWSLELIELTIRHEIGHYFQAFYEDDIDEYFGCNPYQHYPEPASLMNQFSFNRYCRPAWNECLAENFAYYSAGNYDVLDQRIIDFYAAFDNGNRILRQKRVNFG